MSHSNFEISTNFAWTPPEMDEYHTQYHSLASGDSLLAGVVIAAIARRNLIGQFDSAHIIGTGGVPRGAGIVLPTLTETASLVVSDSTEQNVESTRRIFEQIKQGNPLQEHWKLHEQDMAQHNPLWAGAIGQAALIATFRVFDLLGDETLMADVVGMEYVAESMLSDNDKDDYERALDRFVASAREMIYMAYSVNSDGYMVGNKHHPAHRVSVDQVATGIERRGFQLLHNPQDGFAPHTKEFRQGDDPHAFDGFAALVAVRR